ncbi:coiled-coil domain-containing protein 12 [Bacillus rossius redtenbacheri]|uniref:coiled-coil domain-containing protein 12 n=1 Tax=Bacillus rossius redtenbacheri TaxID=93214 RepID=UPI002FDE3B95
MTIMKSEEKVGMLEDEAFKRKERLKALKRKHDNVPQKEDLDNVNKSDLTLPRPKFRSYRPADEALQGDVVEDAEPGDVAGEVKAQLEAAHSRVVIEQLDISNLAPRKLDWDLKRDVARKLERLERRTQRAIAELIRERLRSGQEDLGTAVSAGASAARELDVDED